MVRSLEADRDQVIGHHGRCRRVARLTANANAERPKMDSTITPHVCPAE